MNTYDIDLVIVTYNPNINLLLNLIDSIKHQVRNIYIVDNSNPKCNKLEKLENINVIYLEENMGIAYAQNVGLKAALENSAKYVMLSDQDTIYPSNYVVNMIEAFSADNNVAAIAPLFKDINQKKDNEGFIVKKRLFGSKLIYPKKGFHEVFQVIASGKIILSKYLKDIGFMDESLFIDYVDIEWCWRAKKHKYKIIGNANVLITHKLGDISVDAVGKNITLRSPIRHYYMVRNSLYLSLTCKSLNLMDRFFLFFRAFYLMVGLTILSKPHLIHAKYTISGIIDGFTKRMGKYKMSKND